MAIYEVPLHPTTDAVLAGGGEMGALMRALDWSATPLGPVGDWPQSLRTSVSICLASRFPMLIWWGPELVMLYNDAYRPILGATKHPAAMGQRGRECWPEIWDVIGPMLTGVLARGDATWSEDQLLLLNRNGYVEECYFTFSYSPIRDESGGIGGIFTAVTETTERVLGERRLRTLRALASAVEARTTEDACHRAMDALAENSADIPFALLYLLDTDGSVARLADSVHLAPDTPASPAVIRLDDGQGDTGWPFARVVATAEAARLDYIPRRFGALPSADADKVIGMCYPPVHVYTNLCPSLDADRTRRTDCRVALPRSVHPASLPNPPCLRPPRARRADCPHPRLRRSDRPQRPPCLQPVRPCCPDRAIVPSAPDHRRLHSGRGRTIARPAPPVAARLRPANQRLGTRSGGGGLFQRRNHQ